MGPVRRLKIFYGWIVVACVCVLLFLAFGSVYSFTTFFESFQAEFGTSRSSTSLVFAIAGFIYFSLGAISGQIADRIGSRWVIAFGVAVIGLGLLMSSFATTVRQLYISYGLCIGIGVGFTYVPAVGVVQRWFVVRRGLASGIAVMGIGLGTLGMPVFSAFLIHWSDWRMAYVVMGACVLSCGLVATLLIVDSPGKMGLKPDNASVGAGDDDVPDEGSAAAKLIPAGDVTVRDVLKTRPFWLLYAGTFCASMGLFIPFVHLMPYAKDLGLATSTGVMLLSMIGVGSTVGRFLIGGFADRIGRRLSLACMYAVMGAIFAWWLTAPDFWGLVLLAVIFGTSYGGFVALLPAVTADYFSGANISGIIGALYTSVAIGSLLGPTFAGFMFDLRQSYAIPITASMLAAIFAALCTLFLEKPGSWREKFLSSEP
ncbi:MAG: MFS transporter [Deltaproteobacteria bacterium]|nr:MFS transporter [Deltaproteobacteria bacterium]MBW2676319.1 MFS transporter [Deltaproteobacteria bacterium]